jgi:hypothetical protein
MRFLYGFHHNARVVEFGPYPNLREAQDAFQRIYGYWPDDPAYVERYV